MSTTKTTQQVYVIGCTVYVEVFTHFVGMLHSWFGKSGIAKPTKLGWSFSWGWAQQNNIFKQKDYLSSFSIVPFCNIFRIFWTSPIICQTNLLKIFSIAQNQLLQEYFYLDISSIIFILLNWASCNTFFLIYLHCGNTNCKLSLVSSFLLLLLYQRWLYNCLKLSWRWYFKIVL